MTASYVELRGNRYYWRLFLSIGSYTCVRRDDWNLNAQMQRRQNCS